MHRAKPADKQAEVKGTTASTLDRQIKIESCRPGKYFAHGHFSKFAARYVVEHEVPDLQMSNSMFNSGGRPRAAVVPTAELARCQVKTSRVESRRWRLPRHPPYLPGGEASPNFNSAACYQGARMNATTQEEAASEPLHNIMLRGCIDALRCETSEASNSSAHEAFLVHCTQCRGLADHINRRILI